MSNIYMRRSSISLIIPNINYINTWIERTCIFVFILICAITCVFFLSQHLSNGEYYIRTMLFNAIQFGKNPKN